jgi:hypothetical protein
MPQQKGTFGMVAFQNPPKVLPTLQPALKRKDKEEAAHN